MERICKNCRLYDASTSACTVAVMIDGEAYELPVLPTDTCHWEHLDEEANAQLRQEMKKHTNPYFKAKYLEEIAVPIAIRHVRVYSDGKNGYIEEG